MQGKESAASTPCQALYDPDKMSCKTAVTSQRRATSRQGRSAKGESRGGASPSARMALVLRSAAARLPSTSFRFPSALLPAHHMHACP